MSIFRSRQWPVSEDARAADELLSGFFRDESSMAVVRAADGFAPKLWDAWLRLAPYDLADDETLLERAAAAAVVAGESLAPIPVAETLVTHWLLGVLGPQAAELYERLTGGGVVVTLSWRPPCRGALASVSFGAVADAVVYLEGDRVRVGRAAPVERTDNIAALPVANRVATSADAIVGAGSAAAENARRAIAAWRLLMAAQLVGAGRRSLDLAVDYVQQRQQFGRPIGAFQAVAHRLADVATDLAGAELLVHATAVETGPLSGADSVLLAARADRAVFFAAGAAERAATESLHFHGGYGFALEQDIQLYLRHIKAWTLLVGGRSAALDRAAGAYRQ